MEENKKEVIYIPVEDILPNRFQPRLAFDEKDLNELANSIIKYGVIQPIVVRTMGEKYEIIAGERRYKASVIAGIKKVPAVLMQTDDNTSAEIALLENLQRKNLTPIEEAKSFKKLLDKGFTQEDIATKLGVSQSSIANKIRLLKLPEEVQNALLYNQISERHARSLLVLDNRDLQVSLLKRIITEKLTVKQTEDEVSLLVSANKEEPISVDDEIPEDIQKFLRPQEDVLEPINENKGEIGNPITSDIEILDLKVPNVIDIADDEEDEEKMSTEVEYTEEAPVINPFQNTSIPVNNSTAETTTETINVPSTPFSEAGMALGSSINEKPEEEPQKSIKEQLGDINYEVKEPSIEDLNVSQEYNKIERIDATPEDLEDDEEEENVDALYTNEYGEIDLPKVITSVRDFTSSMGSASTLIDVSEVDLPDKYQITIEIKKN